MEMIQVGDGATITNGRDRDAATVIKVERNGKQVTVQYDTAMIINEDGLGIQGVQNYRYCRNTNGIINVYTFRKNGRYVLRGDLLNSCWRLGINGRHTYRDPHF